MMDNIKEKVTTLVGDVGKLESFSLALSEALYSGNNSAESYQGAMELLYEEVSKLSNLCLELLDCVK